MTLIQGRSIVPEPRYEDGECHHLRREITEGRWATEKESAAAFDLAVPADLFRVWHEVCGVLMHPRPGQGERPDDEDDGPVKVRIDRVLMPTRELQAKGWKYGVIGVELKKSGVKIGRPIAQAMDYGRAVWTIGPSRSRIWLDYVFIWPMARLSGTLASICAQNRIGSAYADDHFVQFGLKSGECGLLEVRHDGRVFVSSVQAGARTGSR